MEEQFTKEVQGRLVNLPADAARITDGRLQAARIVTHTSGGVFVAVDSNLGAVVEVEEGAIEFGPRQ